MRFKPKSVSFDDMAEYEEKELGERLGIKRYQNMLEIPLNILVNKIYYRIGMCQTSIVFFKQPSEDDKHQTVPDRLLKWFTELEEYFFANPINTITRMKPQDKPVKHSWSLAISSCIFHC